MGFLKKNKKNDDILSKKIAELNTCRKMFDNAVHVVNTTVNSLEKISENIDVKIKEIDEYQAKLSETRECLSEERAKTEQVVKNFKALLCAE